MKNLAARILAVSLVALLAAFALVALMGSSPTFAATNPQTARAGTLQPLHGGDDDGDDDDGDDGGGDDDGSDDGGDDHGDEDEIEGFLTSRPDGGLGIWLVECEPSVTCTVVVTTTTELKDGVPLVGAWIEARGIPQPDDSLLAERVRLDDHGDQELVIRLETGVISSTFALAHDLTPIDTLVSQANIHLFATGEDEEDEIDEIRAAPGVVWVEFNQTNTIPGSEGYKTWHWGGEDASGYVNQAAFAQVGVDAAHETQLGSGVIIAVLDTGVASTHPAFLAGAILPGIDLVDGDDLPNDTGPGFGWGHGTHIAGVVAHMAPQAAILPVRVLDANGRGNAFALAYGIEWAVAHGADVINLSLGADAGSQVLSETIASALAQGVVIVAAAGNDAQTTTRYPAGFTGVLAVGAVDENAARAGFSNYGAWVDIAAPGVGITSTVPFSGGLGFAAWSGTSMSAAFVSGGAALVLSGGAPGAEVPDILTSTANMGATPTGVGGVLNAAAAVAAPLDPDFRAYVPLVSTR